MKILKIASFLVTSVATFLLSFLLSSLVLAETANSPAATVSIYDFSPMSIAGKIQKLSVYKGKVLLIANTASKCGFTPQYHDLQQLYVDYKEKGLEVLGFPSNDFADQEPGTDEEIKKFCALNFGVTFPLFARGSVKGPEAQPLFHYLTQQSDAEFQGEIGWNFEKFLIGKDGKVAARFGSFVNPQSVRIRRKIDELISQP